MRCFPRGRSVVPLRRRWGVPCRPCSTMTVFDRSAKLKQRTRAAFDREASQNVDYLRVEIGERLCDRLEDVRDKAFPTVLDLGANSGHLLPFLAERDDVKRVIQLDSCEAALHRDTLEATSKLQVDRIVQDEEQPLPLEDNSVDAVLSNLSMHWVNDLPSLFCEVERVLKPDGVFLAAMFGGDTLQELRSSLVLAEMERKGGVSPHVGPFTNVGDVGSLLHHAGLTMPTLDVEEVVVHYKDAFVLMHELRCMGESNASLKRRLDLVPRSVLTAAAAIYSEMYGEEVNGERVIPATFQIIHSIGWKKHESQSKPLERGSGEMSLQELADPDALQRLATLAQQRSRGDGDKNSK